MAPKNPTPVAALPEYATVLAQCVAQKDGGAAPALVAATDRGRVSIFNIGRLVERRDEGDDGHDDGGGNDNGAAVAAFNMGERVLSMAANGTDVILGKLDVHLFTLPTM